MNESAGELAQFAESASFLLIEHYLEQNRLGHATRAFSAARRTFPSSPSVGRLQHRVPRLLAARGAPDQALAAYREEQYFSPRNLLAALRVGHLFLEAGLAERALRPLEQASGATKPRIAAAALYWLAEAFMAANQRREARSALYALLQRYAEEGSWRQVGLARLGVIEEKLGNLTKAQIAYDQLARIAGDESVRAFGRERSQLLRRATKSGSEQADPAKSDPIMTPPPRNNQGT